MWFLKETNPRELKSRVVGYGLWGNPINQKKKWNEPRCTIKQKKRHFPLVLGSCHLCI